MRLFMEKLNMAEQIKVALACIEVGMPIEKLKNIEIDVKSFPTSAKIKIAMACVAKGMKISDLKASDIDVSLFPPAAQARIYGIQAGNSIDENTKKSFER